MYIIVYMESDPKLTAVLNLYEYERALRSRSDALRWEAMSFIGHRTKSLSCASDSPVKDRRLYSEAGKDAIATLASGFMSSLMSENQRWFSTRLVPRDYRMNIDPVEDLDYSEYVVKSMLSEFTNSNFYSETGLASLDSIIGGYSCELVQENEEEHITFFQTLPPWRCWFDKDLKGNWDTFFYKYDLTGREMIERFGDRLDEDIRRKAVAGLNAKCFEMLYVICDRKKVLNESTGSKLFKKGMKYAVLQISLFDNRIIDESGTNDFPVVIHLWESSVDSQYGVGLVMKYISAFRKLNELAYEDGEAGAKNVHPPMNVPKSMQESFSDDPKARNYFLSGDIAPSQLQQSIDLASATQRLQIHEQMIRKLCYNDYFSWLSNHEQVYTATQVVQVKSEALSQLVPIYGNVTCQKINKLLGLTFINMLNHKRLERPSDGSLDMYTEKDADGYDVLDRDGNAVRKSKSRITFQLVSAMAKQLDTYSDTNAFSYILESVTAIMNIGLTNIADNIDFDSALRTVAVGNGASPQMLKKKAEVDAIRQQREELAAQQMQMQSQLTQSEINRNNAGASNLNNAIGANGGAE